MTVNSLLHNKGHEVWFVRPATSVFDALQLMAEKNIGAVLVLDGEAFTIAQLEHYITGGESMRYRS